MVMCIWFFHAPLEHHADPLVTPQFVIALVGLAVLAGTIAAVFTVKEVTALQGTIAGSVISGCLGIFGFYFGSSKGSQNKDATMAALTTSANTPPPGSTTTTTTTAAPLTPPQPGAPQP